jgi:hypothetical protein
MSMMNDLHQDLSEFITDERDQATLLEIFWSMNDRHGDADNRKKVAQQIVDLRAIYGDLLDDAVEVLYKYKNL